jgi:hypothetical protein
MKHKKAIFRSRDFDASVANVWGGAPSPVFASWRRGEMLRSDLMRGAEMDFRHFAQCLWPVQFD